MSELSECTLLIVIFILGFLAAACIVFVYAPQQEPVHMCDYKACCDSDTMRNDFDCDSMGCPNVIPNWTHPNCSGDPP